MTLKYEFTLPEFIKLTEYTEMMDAFETAIHKDEEEKAKHQKHMKP